MKTEGYRSKSTVAGVGLVSGLFVLAATAWMSCSPGALDCEDPAFNDCEPIMRAAGAAGSAGTGGMAGMPAMAGRGGAGGTGGGGACAPTLMTAVKTCTKFPTVGDVETKLILPKCAKAGCHTKPPTTFAPDMQTAEVFKRLVDQKVTYVGTTCKDDVYIKSSAPATSYFVSKVKDAMPKCSTGGAGAARMPFGEPALPMDEIVCLENYALAVSCK